MKRTIFLMTIFFVLLGVSGMYASSWKKQKIEELNQINQIMISQFIKRKHEDGTVSQASVNTELELLRLINEYVKTKQ